MARAAQPNTCRWIVRPETQARTGCIEINGTTYDVLPVLSSGGNVHGYNLHKWDAEGTVYFVDTDFPEWTCTCPDMKYRRRQCKHCRALRAALARLFSGNAVDIANNPCDNVSR